MTSSTFNTSRGIIRGKALELLPLLWMLMIPILNVFYGILNQPGAQVNSLLTDLDQKIPFVPAFIVPYLIWYPFILVTLIVLFMKHKAVYFRTLLTLCLGLIVCYLTYHFFQTTVPRPVITEHGLFYSLVSFVYQSDNPYNCFPSIHVFTSYLMLKGTFSSPNVSKPVRVLVFIISWSIIFSTVLVKQHVFLDMAAAIALAEFLFFLVKKIARNESI